MVSLLLFPTQALPAKVGVGAGPRGTQRPVTSEFLADRPIPGYHILVRTGRCRLRAFPDSQKPSLVSSALPASLESALGGAGNSLEVGEIVLPLRQKRSGIASSSSDSASSSTAGEKSSCPENSTVPDQCPDFKNVCGSLPLSQKHILKALNVSDPEPFQQPAGFFLPTGYRIFDLPTFQAADQIFVIVGGQWQWPPVRQGFVQEVHGMRAASGAAGDDKGTTVEVQYVVTILLPRLSTPADFEKNC